MEAEINIDNLTDEQQEEMCLLCEACVLNGPSNTQHFQCEGSFCEEALPYLIESINESCPKLRYKITLK